MLVRRHPYIETAPDVVVLDGARMSAGTVLTAKIDMFSSNPHWFVCHYSTLLVRSYEMTIPELMLSATSDVFLFAWFNENGLGRLPALPACWSIDDCDGRKPGEYLMLWSASFCYKHASFYNASVLFYYSSVQYQLFFPASHTKYFPLLTNDSEMFAIFCDYEVWVRHTFYFCCLIICIMQIVPC